jgi:hypothetical protein
VSLQATQVAGPFESREVDYKNSARDAAAAYWCGFVFFAYAIRQDSYGQQIARWRHFYFLDDPVYPLVHPLHWNISAGGNLTATSSWARQRGIFPFGVADTCHEHL